MSASQRRKGHGGERELAGELAALLGVEVRRRVRQHEGDSDIEGVPGWCIEVKRHRTALPGDIAAWWRQACKQAERAGGRPVLFWRVDRRPWRCTWRLSDIIGGDAWNQYALAIEGSVEAWAAVARELAK